MPELSKPSEEVSLAEGFSAESSPAGADAWEDWDVTALVGSTCIGVWVAMRNTTAGAATLGIREDGSALERLYAFLASQIIVDFVPLASTKIIERRANTAASRLATRIVGELRRAG